MVSFTVRKCEHYPLPVLCHPFAPLSVYSEVLGQHDGSTSAVGQVVGTYWTPSGEHKVPGMCVCVCVCVCTYYVCRMCACMHACT